MTDHFQSPVTLQPNILTKSYKPHKRFSRPKPWLGLARGGGTRSLVGRHRYTHLACASSSDWSVMFMICCKISEMSCFRTSFWSCGGPWPLGSWDCGGMPYPCWGSPAMLCWETGCIILCGSSIRSKRIFYI